MADPKRVLVLLRHATPAASQAGVDDHERPLAIGSDLELDAIAHRIKQLPHRVDLVLASTARRVHETVSAVLPQLPETAELQWIRALYLADLDRLLAELHAVPDDVRTVLVCGHNPGLQQLALTLAQTPVTTTPLEREFPPAAIAVLDIETEWSDVAPGVGRLLSFSAPPRDRTARR